MRAFRTMVLVFGLGACPTTASPHIVSVGDPAVSSMRTLSSSEIMQQYGRGNLLDAIRRLRPLLMPRGMEAPTVYLAGLELAGGIEALAAISTDEVTEVQFLHPAAATLRYERAHPAGAIVVELWRRRGTVHVR